MALSAQPKFEVVSIKPNHSSNGDSSDHNTPGRYTAVNVSAAELIVYAFGIKPWQLSGGPAWIQDERWDVTATTGADKSLTDAELGAYLQATAHRTIPTQIPPRQ